MHERLETNTINKKESSFSQETERWEVLVEEVRLMRQVVRKVDYYSQDIDDEFQVTRESGRVEGIFKTWAVPVIPFWEQDKKEFLVSKLNSENDFMDSIGNEGREIMKKWSEKMRDNPMGLWQSLERWRGSCEIYDRRLTRIFKSMPLPEEKIDRVAELFLRLELAFGYSAPFYDLEAMVAGNRKDDFNPIRNGVEVDKGGVLDLVGMMLPSALEEVVQARELDWNGLNWEKISEIKRGLNEKEKSLAIKIARKADINVEDVIFAANVLEWIPMSVGGKSDDVEGSRAMNILDEALTEKVELKSNVVVGKEVNALIRFLNWVPLIKGQMNFDSAESWSYAAVCDTANSLLKEVEQGGVLLEDFESVFNDVLSSQIQELDATSAKGRLLIKLLRESKFVPQLRSKIEKRKVEFDEEVAARMVFLEKEESSGDLKDAVGRFRAGGKAVGIREAMDIFGETRVVGGKWISSEVIERFMRSNDDLWELVVSLDQESDLNRRHEIANLIREIIPLIDVSDKAIDDLIEFFEGEKVVVRSSSFDEDTVVNGAAAGVYDSVVGIETEDIKEGFKRVISSFFSEKAIDYRLLTGASDRPMLGVVVQRFYQGIGGVAFSDKEGWEVVFGDSVQDVVREGGMAFDSFKNSDDSIRKVVERGLVGDEMAKKVGEMVVKAEKMLGGRVDMEFVLDENEVKVLQLRMLGEKSSEETSRTQNVDLVDFRISKLEDVDMLDAVSGNARLWLGDQIDVEKFQGLLFRSLVKNKQSIKEVVLSKRVPRTSHFANICHNLDIKLSFEDEY